MLEVADLEVKGEVEEEARRAAHDDDGRVAAWHAPDQPTGAGEGGASQSHGRSELKAARSKEKSARPKPYDKPKTKA